MAIPDERLYEYAVVRYVPRVDREEFVNIGLIMMCKRLKWLKGEVLLEESRLRAFDPKINLKSLQTQASLFMRTDVPSALLPVEERYRWLTAVKSAVLQVSPSHPGIIPDLTAASGHDSEFPEFSDKTAALESEFTRLFNDLVSC